MPNSTDTIKSSLTNFLRLVPGAVRVTLASRDPDTKGWNDFQGELWGKRTVPKRSRFNVGGGELSAGGCRWRLESYGVEFEPRIGDRITEPTGEQWIIDSVQIGGLGTRFICDATRARNDGS
jgi:hypothetical protein